MSASSPDQERAPLVSCSPWALIVLLCFVSGWLAWREFGSRLRRGDPDAVPRVVTPRGDLAQDEQATIALFDAAKDSVVHITTWERRQTLDRFWLNAEEYPRGEGTGFVWDDKGTIVTNVHVLNGGSRFVITLADGSEYEGSDPWGDKDHDIAMIRIDAPPGKLRPIAIGTSKDLKVGQKVFAIGNPFGLDHTLTTGVISGLNREIMTDPQGERKVIRGVIQTDAAINPGNSGGPLLDSAGRLIGMNTAIYSNGGDSAGIGFAVPVDLINSTVPRLLRVGDSQPVELGVTAAPNQLAEYLGLKGVIVRDVDPKSPAGRAGVQAARGSSVRNMSFDLIVGVDGELVTRVSELADRLAEHKRGDTIQLEILRNGRERLSLPVKL
ncbi:MAG: trypsin-like peptidase domain-containing protein [Planctomycetes bacterium]|nr:trypsin-like peptidase domain-containing protein [Planctomycetota bacterium]